MPRTDVLIIGAGQAGLAMSACLSARGVDHVVVERGEVGQRWRAERWDSLRLLTPNWMTRLPGYAYAGDDPGGFMHKAELIRFLARYAAQIAAPVSARTQVLGVARSGDGYAVTTDRGILLAKSVVVATGVCDVPHVPAWSRDLPRDVVQLGPDHYRTPADLPEGGVLVVGASATGVQLAEEIRLSGREVTIAVGRHTRMPRRYRGRDIMEWLAHCGILDERAEDVRDIEATRRQPSLQLVGRTDDPLDLERLDALGVVVAGRALGLSERRIRFASDLAETCAAAEARRQRVLSRIDAFVAERGIDAAPDPEAWRAPRPPDAPEALATNAVRSVVWATGYRRRYPWLDLPILDAAGELIHTGGVTPVPGVYALGLRFMRRRYSNFIAGAGLDAAELALHLCCHLGHRPRRAA